MRDFFSLTVVRSVQNEVSFEANDDNATYCQYEAGNGWRVASSNGCTHYPDLLSALVAMTELTGQPLDAMTIKFSTSSN